MLAGNTPATLTCTGADDQAGRVRLGFPKLHFHQVIFPYVGYANAWAVKSLMTLNGDRFSAC